jgi:hypothetical protein
VDDFDFPIHHFHENNLTSATIPFKSRTPFSKTMLFLCNHKYQMTAFQIKINPLRFYFLPGTDATKFSRDTTLCGSNQSIPSQLKTLPQTWIAKSQYTNRCISQSHHRSSASVKVTKLNESICS